MDDKNYSDLQEILEDIGKISCEDVLKVITELESGKLKSQSLSKKIYRVKKNSEWDRWLVLGLSQFIWRGGIKIDNETN